MRVPLVALASVLFWVPAAGAAPFGGALTLDASGSYQGYGLEDEELRAFDHSLREELRGAFEGYLVAKSIASWRVGAALDNQTIFGEDGTITNRPSYQYDWRLATWSDGVVPLRLYGSHQTNAAQIATDPEDGVVSDIYGYNTALNLEGLPRLDSSGYYQLVRSTYDGVVDEDQSAALHGGLYQSSSNTVARASVDWGMRQDALSEDYRDTRSITGDANYRISPDVVIAGHATGREYRYRFATGESTVGSTESNAFVRWRQGRDANGMAYVEQHRSALDDSVYGGLSAGATASRRFPRGFSVDGDVGLSWDEVEEAGEVSRYLGEFGRVSGSHAASGAFGTTQLVATGGIANLSEIGVGSGLQAGGGLRGSYGRNVFGFARANLGGLVAAQTDSSPLDDDWVSAGWNAAINTQRWLGLEVGASANGVSVYQLSRDDGNSDELRATGIASLRVAAFLRIRYTLGYDWLRMDDEFSEGLGHTLRADLRVSGPLTLSALGYHTRWATSAYDPTEWWRAEGLASFRIGMVDARGRVFYDRYEIGDGEPSAATGILVEVSRRFRWSF